MSARRVAAVARRIVEQFRRDRRTLGLLIVVPLAILALIGYLFQPQGAASREPVAIVLEDQGPLGALLADAFARSDALDARRMSAAEAEAALRDGTVHGTITLPRDMTAGVLTSRRVDVRLRLEGSDMFVNAGVQAAFARAAADAASDVLAAAEGGSAPLLPRTTYLHAGPDWTTLDYLAPALLPYLAFFFVFLLTDVSFLRERSSGTLERLLATPLRRGELVLGYLAGFAIFATIQAVVLVLVAVYVLGLRHVGPVWAILVVDLLVVLGAVNLGVLLSAFARNEFQAVQFIPVVVLPQALLCGIFIPVSSLPDLLRPVAWALPLTYAAEASRAVTVKGAALTDPLVLRDLGALLVLAVVLAALAIRTVRREIA